MCAFIVQVLRIYQRETECPDAIVNNIIMLGLPSSLELLGIRHLDITGHLASLQSVALVHLN